MMVRCRTNRRIPESRRTRSGALLLELVVSTAILGIIVAGIHASLFIAMRSIPDPQGLSATTMQADHIVDQFVTELETAVHVTDRSATSFGFTVPDRDGDGLNERIRYAWNGMPGGALTRQYNGGTPLVIADHVHQFTLTPDYRSVAETYPAVGTEDAKESLLINNDGISGTADHDVTLTDWVGQYHTLTLPAGAYRWRPTRVEFMARKSSSPAVSLAQMRYATANMTPSDTVLEQAHLADTTLADSYAWVSVPFPTLDPIPSGGAICFVVRHALGLKTLTARSTGGVPGLARTFNEGSTWAYDGGRCLSSRLYGKLTRSNGTLSLNSRYLTSLAIAVRMTGNAPVLQTTAAMLNHPELLSGKWELKFLKDPTTVDVNGDGLGDWVVNSGATFPMASLVNGTWQTSGTELNTNPGNGWLRKTAVDVRFRTITVGGSGATLKLNALRSGPSCAPIHVSLTRTPDSTQTLILSTKLTDLVSETRLRIAGLPDDVVLLQLIIDPTPSSVNIRVNGVQYGTYALTPYVSIDSNRFAAIGASGCTAEFSYVRLRVMEDQP